MVGVITQPATEFVRVTVPARAEFVQVLRSVTASVAGRLPLSLDDVDDLRLAVDECCARLLDGGGARTFRLDLRPLPGRLEVIVSADSSRPRWPPPGVEGTLGWQILVALAESVAFEWWNGTPSIRLVKSTMGGRE